MAILIDLTTYETKLKTDGPIATRELREERHRLLDESRSVLNRADTAKRRLTDAERDTIERNKTDVRTLADLIDKCEIHTDLYREQSSQESERERRTATGGDVPALSFRNVETGERVRAVRHGESFRTATGSGAPDLNLGRMIRGAATGDWRGAEGEYRAYSQGAAAGGGYLLNPEMSTMVIDLARAQSVVSAAGAITVPMATEELKIARVESDPTAYWTGENQEITESSGTFGLITMRSKALAVYCTASMELVRNAANAEELITATVAKAIAAKLDASALNGVGADSEPSGLLNTPGIGTYDVSGAISFDKMIRASATLWAGNVEPNAMIYDAALRRDVALLKDGEGRYYREPPREVAALRPFMASTIGSTDANAAAYIGDFSRCIFGIRNQIEIEVSGVADGVFKRKQVAIRGLLWGDFYACRASDITRLCGITTST